MKKHAVFMAGGGGKGRWQAAATYALARAGKLDQVCAYFGSSVGSLDGALAAVYAESHVPELESAGADEVSAPPLYEAIKQRWDAIQKNSDVYTGTLDGSFFSNIGALIKLAFTRSALGPAPLYAMLRDIFGAATLESWATLAGRHVCFTASDLTAGCEIFFSSYNEYKGLKLFDVLCASAAIPGAFPTVRIKLPNGETHEFADGGLGANNPLAAIDDYNDAFPADPIKKAIIIFTSPDVDSQAPNFAAVKNGLDALGRSVTAALSSQEQIAERFAELLSEADALEVLALYPAKDTGGALDFTPRTLWADGEKAGDAAQGWDYKTKTMMSVDEFLNR